MYSISVSTALTRTKTERCFLSGDRLAKPCGRRNAYPAALFICDLIIETRYARIRSDAKKPPRQSRVRLAGAHVGHDAEKCIRRRISMSSVAQIVCITSDATADTCRPIETQKPEKSSFHRSWRDGRNSGYDIDDLSNITHRDLSPDTLFRGTRGVRTDEPHFFSGFRFFRPFAKTAIIRIYDQIVPNECCSKGILTTASFSRGLPLKNGDRLAGSGRRSS
jgi:hypothetical protein